MRHLCLRDRSTSSITLPSLFVFWFEDVRYIYTCHTHTVPLFKTWSSNLYSVVTRLTVPVPSHRRPVPSLLEVPHPAPHGKLDSGLLIPPSSVYLTPFSTPITSTSTVLFVSGSPPAPLGRVTGGPVGAHLVTNSDVQGREGVLGKSTHSVTTKRSELKPTFPTSTVPPMMRYCEMD